MNKTLRPNLSELTISQIPALITLIKMGYSYLTPSESIECRDGSENEVILTKILDSQIRKINTYKYDGKNRSFSDANVKSAIKGLRDVTYEGLILTNEKIYDLLTLGRSLPEFIGTRRESFDFKFIDWETPANNVFHVTAEYRVDKSSSDGSRIPDIVTFVNGIPFGVIECKSVYPDAIEDAVSQSIRNQKDAHIPKLFFYSQILLALAKEDAMYATVGTSRPFWFPWREEDQKYKDDLTKVLESTLPSAAVSKLFSGEFAKYKSFENRKIEPKAQEVALYGLFEPNRALDLIKNFTLFDGGERKIARFQQYFAVKDVMNEVKASMGTGERPGGIVWHHQGSGKSLTMVMLAKAIAIDPDILNPKIILLTDRVDLDDQIYGTFKSCNLKLEQADSGEHLIRLLNDTKASIITSVINKFQTVSKDNKYRNESRDVFILVDEAHRTQYGSLAAMVDKVFPNACFVAYTGTPLTKSEKKNTLRKYQRLIHQYTSRDALRDKAIVPLIYEGRLIEQALNREIIDNLFEIHSRGLTDKQKADLKKKFNTADNLSKTEQRLYLVALDISLTFEKNFKGTGFKGQLAVDSRKTAVRMHELFKSLGIISSEVVISPPSEIEGHEDPLDQSETSNVVRHFWDREMLKYRNEKMRDDSIISKFKGPDEPELLIVAHRLLTGFDVPRNAVLFIDKQMKEEHNLLQAIARVNRKMDGKDHGLIIDYRGNLGTLSKAINLYDALADYDKEDLENVIFGVDEELQLLPQRHSDLLGLFVNVKDKADLNSYIHALSDEEQRNDFYKKLNVFSRSLATALASAKFLLGTPEDTLRSYKSDLIFFRKLRKYIKTVFSETVDYAEYEPQIEHILHTHVLATEVTTVIPPVDVYSKDFSKDLEGKSDTAKALTKLTRLEKHLSEKWKDNDPEYYEKFSKLLADTIERIRESRLKDAEAIRVADDLEQKIATRSGDEIPDVLNGKGVALAYYGIIKKVFEGKEQSDEVDVRTVSGEVAIKIEKIIDSHRKVDWTKDTDVQNAMKNEIEDYLIENARSFGVAVDYEEIDLILEGVLNIARVRLA